jgi:RNA polymerase sigma-70 factor (ECF subfamily)
MNNLLDSIPLTAGDTLSQRYTDEYLMEVIQAHGTGGLTQLRDRYGSLLKALSMSILHNDADSDDLLQEVYLEIWNRAATYDSLKGKPLSWLVTLTRRRSIDRLRKREAYGRLEERFAEEIKGRVGSWTHVHEDLAQGERNAHLQRALATLPAAQRNAIRLAYHKGMTQREIADHTGIPLGTIKTRLELGLKKLAGFLRGFEDLLSAEPTSSDGRRKVTITAACLVTPEVTLR